MNDIIDIEIILKRKKYPKVYSIGIILIVILLIITYIIFTYEYQSYYITYGKVVDNKLEVLMPLEDAKYLKSNSLIELDNKPYNYTINSISNDIVVDASYKNYQVFYLNINNLSNLNNYAYQVKIPKENEIIAKYLKKYV